MRFGAGASPPGGITTPSAKAGSALGGSQTHRLPAFCQGTSPRERGKQGTLVQDNVLALSLLQVQSYGAWLVLVKGCRAVTLKPHSFERVC